MAREFRGGGETGRTFESRLFGTAQVNPQFLLDLDAIGLDARGRFKSRGEVYDAFKRNYLGAGVGERGETSMSTDLRQAVEDALGFQDETDELKFYSAIGTVIDHKFGVDAFFELSDPKTGDYARVTLDATLNKEKQLEGWKADIIIGELPDAGQEPDAYIERIEEIGTKIAIELARRLRKHSEPRRRWA